MRKPQHKKDCDVACINIALSRLQLTQGTKDKIECHVHQSLHAVFELSACAMSRDIATRNWEKYLMGTAEISNGGDCVTHQPKKLICPVISSPPMSMCFHQALLHMKAWQKGIHNQPQIHDHYFGT